MSKKSKVLVSINHLPGILLASAAECERWITAGLIPVAEYRTLQKRGRIVEAPMFDTDSVTQLAAEVPAWRMQGENGDTERHACSNPNEVDTPAAQPIDDAAHRRRQSILAPVRKNMGIYVAEDIRKIESGRWKPERP